MVNFSNKNSSVVGGQWSVAGADGCKQPKERRPMGKRGWIRIMEVSIAIMMLGAVLLVVFNRQAVDISSADYVSAIEKEIVDEISLNSTLYSHVLAGNEAAIETFIDGRVTNIFLNYSVKICDLTTPVTPCDLDSDISDRLIDRDLFVKDIIVSADLTTYSPKKLRLFMWGEINPRKIGVAAILQFVTLATQQAVSNEGVSIYVDVNDEITSTFISVNDSRFDITDDYNLVNTTVLGTGNYSILIAIYDADGEVYNEVVTIEIILGCDVVDVNYQDEVCLSDVVGYWSFDDDFAATVYDRSGNGNNGTYVGGASSYNGSLILDGVDDYLELGQVSIPSNFTVSFWIKTNEDTDITSWNGILSEGGYSTGFRFLDYQGYIMGQFTFGSDTTPTHLLRSSDIDDGDWHQYVVTYDHSTLVGYFDGVPHATYNNFAQTQDLKYSVSTLRLGYAQYYFNGSIDEFVLFDDALMAEEVSEIYSLGR